MGLDVTFYKIHKHHLFKSPSGRLYCEYGRYPYMVHDTKTILELRKPYVLHENVMDLLSDDKEALVLYLNEIDMMKPYKPFLPDYYISKEGMDILIDRCFEEEEEEDKLDDILFMWKHFDFKKYALLYSYC